MAARACLSTSGRIHSEFLRLLYFLADRQASDYFTALGYEPHKEDFCHRRILGTHSFLKFHFHWVYQSEVLSVLGVSNPKPYNRVVRGTSAAGRARRPSLSLWTFPAARRGGADKLVAV